jgi:predicted ATPase
VDFFRMLRAMADEALQPFVTQHGGADGFFHLGPKHTHKIAARMDFGENAYAFSLVPTSDDQVMIKSERYSWLNHEEQVASGRLESALHRLRDQKSKWHCQSPGIGSYIYQAISSWVVYHFHDTSLSAPMRRDQSARDRKKLRQDASNIAAFLLETRGNAPGNYELIRDTVRMIAPFFDDFLLEPQDKGPEEKIRLEWRQKGSDYPFQPYQLSDGTMRFICLATALSQPEPPSTVLIDEPELGLHPYAISILADLIKSASTRTQLVISTQSPTLLDYFEPQDVVVVNRERGRSAFNRLDGEDLKQWLAEYTVGELWQKNVVDGGPRHE